MRRKLAFFLFFVIFGLLGTMSFLQNQRGGADSKYYPAPEPAEISVVKPDVTSSEPSDMSPAYLTSHPCDCPGDRLLYLTEPWMRGPEVVEVQRILQASGDYPGGVDGVFGPVTAAAVSRFQEKRGQTGDGLVDLDTWRVLADSSLPAAGESTPPPPGEVRIKIDIYDRRLTVYSDETPYKSYPVAVGQQETPTPVGYFAIVSKERWGEGFGTRWMQLSTRFGKYGIHGTNKPWSIGGFESHGCIRMHNRHVEEIFQWVKVGTKVNIIKDPWGALGNRPTLRRGGIKGSPVMLVQQRLKQLGYYKDIGVDGIFGGGTYEAVRNFQADNNLPQTGIVNQNTYDALGLFYFE